LVYVGSEDKGVYGFGPLSFGTAGGSIWGSIIGYVIIAAVAIIIIAVVLLVLSRIHGKRGSRNQSNYQQ
jgi:uncharacterized membrane protein